MSSDPWQPGHLVTVRVEGLGFAGEGLATIEGKRLVLPHALPGEEVVAEVVRVPAFGAVRTRVREVRDPSPERIDPACPHYDRCPGCHLRHVPYAKELSLKRATVVDAMTRFAGIEAGAVDEVRGAPTRDGYRTRARGTWAGGRRVMAPLAPSDPPIPLDACPVLSPDLRTRCAVPDASAVEGEAAEVLPTDAPAGWTLPNPSMAAVLLDLVLELLAPAAGERVIEVGCGNGGLTEAVARRSANVVGLDLDRDALAAAAERLEAAGLTPRVDLRSGRLEKVARRLLRAHGSFDAALLNPMRRRLGSRAMRALIELGTRRAVYIGPSCVPTARDIGVLVEAGWSVPRVVPVDLYPGTYHVLTVAFLRADQGA